MALAERLRLVDAAMNDEGAMERLQSYLYQGWARADKGNRLNKDRISMLKEGYLPVAVDVLKKYTADQDLLRCAGAVVYNVSRDLPFSREVRQYYLDAKIGSHIVPEILLVSPMKELRLYGVLISALLSNSGHKHGLKLAPECFDWLGTMLASIRQGESFMDSSWAMIECATPIAVMCMSKQNSGQFVANGVLENLLYFLLHSGDFNHSEDEVQMMSAAVSRMSWLPDARAVMMNADLSFLEELKQSENSAIKTNALSIMFALDPDRVEVQQAFLKACERGSKKWGRSQLCLVGMGRAGKTSFLNSIMGHDFVETDSTIGINNMTCEVTSLNSGKNWWNPVNKAALKELEMAKAEMTAIMCKGGTSLGSTVLDEDESQEKGEVEKIKKKAVSEPEKHDAPPSGGRRRTITTFDAGPTKMDRNLVLECMQDDGIEDHIMFETWDFGGQDVFYSLHHLFLTPYAIYVVLFNMEWFDGGEAGQKTALGFVEFWLNSIALHTAVQKGSTAQQCAPIILVGTHKDKVKSPAQHENISKLLYDTFCDTPAWPYLEPNHEGEVSTGRGLLWFFPVDNTVGHSDGVIPAVLHVIEKLAKQAEYTKQEVPFSWLKCYDKMMAEPRAYLSLTEASNIAKESGLPVSRTLELEKEVSVMLEFFNGLGKLMWNQEESLRDLVILRPAEFLIPPATKVICQHDIHVAAEHVEARKIAHLWKQLTNEARLDQRLLSVLWKPYKEHEFLQLLMVRFGLLVPLRQTQEDRTQERYLALVPSLLCERPLSQSEKSLTAYIIFTMNKSEFPSTTRVSDTSGRFMPIGLFPRILGKVVSWSQQTGGMTAVTSKREVKTSFGAHAFVLQDLVDKKCVQLSVLVNNPQMVVSNLCSMVREVLDECMPSLGFFVALPMPGDPELLLNRSWVLDKSQTSSQVWIGEKMIPEHEFQRLFQSWLPPSGLLSSYDVFFSYRQGKYDSDFLAKVFDCLTSEVIGTDGRRVDVFWDKVRLQQGRKFDDDFMVAMLKSTGAVPLVSLSALQRMKQLTESSPLDNVLLEWTLMLELYQAESARLQFILPIFMGEISSEQGKPPIGNLWSALPPLPEVVSKPVVEKVSNFLHTHGLQLSESLHTRTVKGTVDEMMKLMGVRAWAVQPRLSNPTAIDIAFDLHSIISKEIFVCIQAKPVRKDSVVVPSQASAPPDAQPSKSLSSASSGLAVQEKCSADMATWLTACELGGQIKQVLESEAFLDLEILAVMTENDLMALPLRGGERVRLRCALQTLPGSSYFPNESADSGPNIKNDAAAPKKKKRFLFR